MTNWTFFIGSLIFIGIMAFAPIEIWGTIRIMTGVLAFFIILRFGSAFIETLAKDTNSSREDRLIIGIVYSWAGTISLSIALVPYMISHSYSIPIQSYNPIASRLIAAGITCHFIGAILHLVSQRRPFIWGHINKWAAIGIPTTILIGLAVFFFERFS